MTDAKEFGRIEFMNELSSDLVARQVDDRDLRLADIHADHIAKNHDLRCRYAKENDQRTRITQDVQEFFVDEGDEAMQWYCSKLYRILSTMYYLLSTMYYLLSTIYYLVCSI